MGSHPLWLLVLAALACWQIWATLDLFGPRGALERLLNDQPLVSGRHPLHLYHGYLGARSLLQRGSLLCYDPSFHAGYPKTPVFDSGSRPAELALVLTGGRFSPAAYKVGLTLVSSLVPWLVWLAARGMGLSRGGACLAGLLGMMVWWGGPCQDAFRAGEVDLLLAGLLILVQSGLLIKYHYQPTLGCYLGVVLTGFLGWLAHPLLLVVVLPLFLVYYVSVGVRHHLSWHVTLLGGLLTAIAVNLFWLVTWMEYCWIRLPLQAEEGPLADELLQSLWRAPLWGGELDRMVFLGLLGAAVGGILLLHCGSGRPAARLFGLGTVGLLLLSLAGLKWSPVCALGSARLLTLGLLFATPLAAHLFVCVLGGLRRRAGPAVAALVAGMLGLAVGGLALWEQQPAWLVPMAGRHGDLEVGLTADRQRVVRQLIEETTGDARILWEDVSRADASPHWTTLLPLLTGRGFIGALDPEARIEHTVNGLCDQVLAGRAIRTWSDEQLMEYCERYNVGWVVSWTAGTTERLKAWSAAEPAGRLKDGLRGGHLFRIDRYPTYALHGSAEWLHADPQGILLGNVVPHQGRVVLSLHYQAGLKAIPGRVRIEPELDPRDPIPLVRLVVDEPVARVTLTWSHR